MYSIFSFLSDTGYIGWYINARDRLLPFSCHVLYTYTVLYLWAVALLLLLLLLLLFESAAIEERMFERVLRRYALGCLEAHEFLDQICELEHLAFLRRFHCDKQFVELRQFTHRLPALARCLALWPIQEAIVEKTLRLLALVRSLHKGFRDVTKNLLHHRQMFKVVVGVEEDNARDKFDKNASDAPEIAREGPSESKNHLRRSVVSRRHDGRVAVVHKGRAAKIDEFDVCGFRDPAAMLGIWQRDLDVLECAQEDIFRFEIRVHEIETMNVPDTDEKLEGEVTNLVHVERVVVVLE